MYVLTTKIAKLPYFNICLVLTSREINFIGPADHDSYTCKVPTHHGCYGQIQGVCFSGGVIYNPVKP